MAHTRYWTDPERDRLRKMQAEGLPPHVISERLGRPIDAVRRELNRLGLRERRKPKTTLTLNPEKETLRHGDV